MTADPIINDLLHIKETAQELEVLNFYQGFPVTCKAHVESINRDVVVLKVQPPGSVILEGQKDTILLSRALPEAVKAGISSFDLLGGTLHLRDFVFISADFGKRMAARVVPEKPIPVEIEDEGQRASGHLVDVSLKGAGVLVKDPAFQRGQVVQVTLLLPGGRTSLPGKISSLTPASGGFTRLAISFPPMAQETAVIMLYIMERRAKILAEVEQMYAHTFQARLAQDEEKTE